MLVIRADQYNFPLLLHVAGAMLLVATLIVAAACLVLAWRQSDPTAAASLIRYAFRTMLYAVLPSYLLMHVAAEWISSREGYNGDVTPSWIDLGYALADGGGLLLLISIILTGIAARRAGRAPSVAGRLVRAGTVLALLVLGLFVVAIWAMTTKPT
jgi:uncharacterized membrane protein